VIGVSLEYSAESFGLERGREGLLMRNLAMGLALGLAAVSLAGCKKEGEFTEADAATWADATQAAWVSMDLAKIEAVYAHDLVGFDPGAAPLAKDWATWHKLNGGFAAMKFNAMTVADRKIQILSHRVFVVSGTATLTSKDGPMKLAKDRFTDVYQMQKDGKWLIVNEHVSFVPEATKG
jgi:ketosteroid isomerase-like protein